MVYHPESDMQMIPTTLFVKRSCPRCTEVRPILDAAGLKYDTCEVPSMRDIPDLRTRSLASFPVLRTSAADKDYFGIMEEYGEPILLPNPDRYVLFPIQYEDLYNMYNKAKASFWVAEEIDLSKDTADWEAMDEQERFFVKHVLAFFAASDGIVNENLCANFCHQVQIPEARAFYTYQQFNETIHSETYATLLDTYVTDPTEKQTLLRAIETVPAVKKKAEWAQRWITQTTSFAERLVAFACVEGIQFSGSFCAIFWLKTKGVLPGLCFSNELISRDEGLHQDFATTLYKHLRRPLDKETVERIVREAVETEEEFIIEALPCRLLGMNADLMLRYIHFVADSLLRDLGYGPVYHESNPFDFMQHMDVQGKTNFFERRVGEYAKHHATTGMEKNATLQFEDDF